MSTKDFAPVVQKALFCGGLSTKPRGVALCQSLLALGSQLVTGC